MPNFYSELTTKIIEKNAPNPENIDVIRRDIRFIAEKLWQEHNIEAQIDSAFCYYIAGYYVQALYVAQRVEIKQVSPIQRCVLLFIVKNFGDLQKFVDGIATDRKYDDEYIKEQIGTKGLSDIEAAGRIVESKIAEIVRWVISFVHTGDESKLSQCFITLKVCQKIASKLGQWADWWRLECLKLVISEFVENSLWVRLRNFSANEQDAEIVRKYVVANYDKRKITELWRSQIESLPKINDIERCSFCISVPTSGGKTTVAELAILRFLLDYESQTETKCVYIAPFRKLALEVESALSKSFNLVNASLISTFYGGRELDALDNREVEKARILIVTPEKLDSMLRQYPNLLSQIKLVIADEGHMIGDKNLRGYRYRLLLERLIYKLRIRRASTNERPRIILISGVMPNIEDFADLISGNRTNIVKIDWRPLGKPSIGSWDWTGKDLRTRDPNLIEPIPFDTKCNSHDEFEEIVAKVALSYAHAQPTMVFSASKRAIESPSLLNFLECVANNHNLFKSKPLPKNLERSTKYQQYYSLLEKGVAIHHANLPRDLRKEMENRIDNQQVRLLFASPTLAHGVNIPFHNVLVYRLQHYYGVPIPHATFWNVVGRVGRPIKSKTAWNTLEPPRVLFFLNKSPKSNDEDQKDSRLSIELMDKRAQYHVAGPFLQFLEQILIRWNETSPDSISDLFSNLSEKDNLRDAVGEAIYNRLKPIDKISVDDFLKILDEHICVLLTENEVDETIASEWLQQSASDLVDLFVKASEINSQYLEDIKKAVLARIKFNVQHLSSIKRNQNYLLGLPVKDCEEIEKNEDLLLKWYQECSGMFAQDFDNGLNGLINILNFISTLSICKKWQIKKRVISDGQMSFDLKIADKKSTAQSSLFRGWIVGEEPRSLESLMREFLPKIGVDVYRESMFESNLSWGVSAVCRFLRFAGDQKGLSLTKDLDYLSTFVKYGVNSKIACHLVRLHIPRTDAVKISRLYQEKLQAILTDEDELPSLDTDFSEAIKSLNMLTDNQLKAQKISRETMKRITEIRKNYSNKNTDVEPEFPPLETDPIYDDEYLSLEEIENE
jgi:superfamily II DNA/RNA helicase